MKCYNTPYLPYFIIDARNSYFRLISKSKKLIYSDNKSEFIRYNVAIVNKMLAYRGIPSGCKAGISHIEHKLFILRDFMDDVLHEPLKQLYKGKIKMILYKNYKFVLNDVKIDDLFILHKIIAMKIMQKLYKRVDKANRVKKVKSDNIIFGRRNIVDRDYSFVFKEILLIDENNPEKRLNFYVNTRGKKTKYGKRKYY